MIEEAASKTLSEMRALVRTLRGDEQTAYAPAASVADLERLVTLAVTLPWVGAELAATRELLGDDVWPYGVDVNRAEIETLIRYSVEQGILPQAVAVDELFAPSTLVTAKI